MKKLHLDLDPRYCWVKKDWVAGWYAALHKRVLSKFKSLELLHLDIRDNQYGPRHPNIIGDPVHRWWPNVEMNELVELQFLPLKHVTVICMETSKCDNWPHHSKMSHAERLEMAENIRTRLLDFQGKEEQSREEKRKTELEERSKRRMERQKERQKQKLLTQSPHVVAVSGPNTKHLIPNSHSREVCNVSSQQPIDIPTEFQKSITIHGNQEHSSKQMEDDELFPKVRLQSWTHDHQPRLQVIEERKGSGCDKDVGVEEISILSTRADGWDMMDEDAIVVDTGKENAVKAVNAAFHGIEHPVVKAVDHDEHDQLLGRVDDSVDDDDLESSGGAGRDEGGQISSEVDKSDDKACEESIEVVDGEGSRELAVRRRDDGESSGDEGRDQGGQSSIEVDSSGDEAREENMEVVIDEEGSRELAVQRRYDSESSERGNHCRAERVKKRTLPWAHARSERVVKRTTLPWAHASSERVKKQTMP
jgi:hypothetical protein